MNPAHAWTPVHCPETLRRSHALMAFQRWPDSKHRVTSAADP